MDYFDVQGLKFKLIRSKLTKLKLFIKTYFGAKSLCLDSNHVMMRKELAKAEGERKKFRAVFSRLGKKTGYNGYSEETILLKDIVEADNNRPVSDHLWFSFSKGFQSLRLTEGTRIEFEARIKKYIKGYVNKAAGIHREKTDYRLSHPTKIKMISEG